MSEAKDHRRLVVVCDDDGARVDAWSRRLRAVLPEADFDVRPLSPGDFGEAVRALHERLKIGKSGGEIIRDADGAELLDAADVLVIDSDLTPDPTALIDPASEKVIDDFLVGEYGSNVARLARGYSTAGLLVVVNHIYKERTFDLTMRRFSELPADAYITAADLDSRGLWFGEASGAFRPWSWPNLSSLDPPEETTLPMLSLDSLIVEALGLSTTDVDRFEDRQWERLLFDDSDVSSATLRTVAESNVFGLGPKPEVSVPERQQLRIAKSALRRWLDHVVLPSQNVFVDLPHLLQDRPWLAGVARKDAQSLNQLVQQSWTEPAVFPEAVAGMASSLLGRQVWRADKIPARDHGDRLEPDDLVFCEDTSDFRAPDDAHEFASDIEGQFRSRFVARVSGVEYTPIRRLFAR